MTNPTDSPEPEDVEHATERALDASDRTVEADVVTREAGVRIRTNIQSGGASERVNVTAEAHAATMGDLVEQLPAYRNVLGEQLMWARQRATEANE